MGLSLEYPLLANPLFASQIRHKSIIQRLLSDTLTDRTSIVAIPEDYATKIALVESNGDMANNCIYIKKTSIVLINSSY